MIEALIGGVVTLAVAVLGWLGVRYTARQSRSANADTVTVAEQANAVQAWESMVNTLLVPLKEEVLDLRRDLDEERRSRKAEQGEQARRLEEQRERIDLLTIQLKEWKRLAKVIARWATTLRDEVIRAGGTVPASPEELLLIQSIDDVDL